MNRGHALRVSELVAWFATSHQGSIVAVQRVAGLVSVFRKRRGADDLNQAFRELLDLLQREPGYRDLLSANVFQLVGQVRCVHALTESGIVSSRGFFEEAFGKVFRHFLPELSPLDDLRGLIRRVFHDRNDHQWLRRVDPSLREQLLRTLLSKTGLGPSLEQLTSIQILAINIASLGLDPELTERMPELDEQDSPFLRLGGETLRYVQCLREGGDQDHVLRGLRQTLAACRESVRLLRARKDTFGTSLRLTTLSFRLFQQIERLDVLLRLTSSGTDAGGQSEYFEALWRLVTDLVCAENTRKSLRSHVKQGVDLLAYQVVEHAAKRGTHYITATRAEYLKFLRASMVGGVVVGVFSVVKLYLDVYEGPLATKAIAYSLNYALCFSLIHAVGGVLATKQPAMTANTVARALDGHSGDHELANLAQLIVRVARSQFISFVGNVTCAFPVATALGALAAFFGLLPVHVGKALYLLSSQSPWTSGALFYAALAGVYLFVAGLVSGYADNRNLHVQLSERVAQHPWLVRVLGVSWARRLGALVDRNLGVVSGNVFLGLMLGSTGTVGVILGLPLEIRHIAFSSAHLGVGLYALRESVPWGLVSQAFLGVALIGFLNFIVSFGLTLATAVESRQITFRESRSLSWMLLKRLVLRPHEFFLAPPDKSGEQADSDRA